MGKVLETIIGDTPRRIETWMTVMVVATVTTAVISLFSLLKKS